MGIIPMFHSFSRKAADMSTLKDDVEIFKTCNKVKSFFPGIESHSKQPVRGGWVKVLDLSHNFPEKEAM